jgi:hypothetical protein
MNDQDHARLAAAREKRHRRFERFTQTPPAKARALAMQSEFAAGQPIPPPSIAQRLREHLAGDGTANDNTTDALYREAKRIPDDQETDLEAVEKWAYHLSAVVNA